MIYKIVYIIVLVTLSNTSCKIFCYCCYCWWLSVSVFNSLSFADWERKWETQYATHPVNCSFFFIPQDPTWIPHLFLKPNLLPILTWFHPLPNFQLIILYNLFGNLSRSASWHTYVLSVTFKYYLPKPATNSLTGDKYSLHALKAVAQ